MSTSADNKLDAILKAIQSLETRVTRIESVGIGQKAAAPGPGSKKLSIKEFLLEHPPTTDIQRTLAVGCFLEAHAGMASFTRADLERGYQDAREPAPSNISVNIKHCIKQGHMMEAQEMKENKTAYVITRSGEHFVAAGYKKRGT
ncbi:MAG: hypothetical protein KBA31_09625 [Alphaproteobacteria bacterium]|nr:hypothetical protein [Alphaproteobacteria bacterium]